MCDHRPQVLKKHVRPILILTALAFCTSANVLWTNNASAASAGVVAQQLLFDSTLGNGATVDGFNDIAWAQTITLASEATVDTARFMVKRQPGVTLQCGGAIPNNGWYAQLHDYPVNAVRTNIACVPGGMLKPEQINLLSDTEFQVLEFPLPRTTLPPGQYALFLVTNGCSRTEWPLMAYQRSDVYSGGQLTDFQESLGAGFYRSFPYDLYFELLDLNRPALACSALAPSVVTVGSAAVFKADAINSVCQTIPTFDWDFGDGSAHSSDQNPSHTYTTAGTFTWTLRVNAGSEASCIRTDTITINQPCNSPTILTQPNSQIIDSGQTATLTATATGTPPLSFQWYKGVTGNTAAPVGGASSNTLVTQPLTTDTMYWMRVTNSCGSIDTDTATVTINTELNPSLTLFDSSRAAPVDFLGPQQHIHFDSAGKSHTYHVFAVANAPDKTINPSQLKLLIKSEPSGSSLIVSVPPGDDPYSQDSGGVIQVVIPFGLTVSSITGANANLNPSVIRDPLTQATRDAFRCAFKELAEAGLDYLTFNVFSSSQCILPVVREAFSIHSAGDLCDLRYPLSAASLCLEEPGNNALFGSRVLNTHQVRNQFWKPSAAGLSASHIKLNFKEPSGQVISLIKQKGLTVYVTTPNGDYLLDNFR